MTDSNHEFKLNELGSKKNLFALIYWGICFLVGGLVALISQAWILFIGITVILSLSPFFISHPKRLFYLYMIGFVFGEIGFTVSAFLPKLSLSNLLFIYAFVIIVINALINRESLLYYLFGTSRRRLVSCLSIFLLIDIFVTGLINSSLRFFITQLGYFIVVFTIFYVVRSGGILRKGLTFAAISIVLLSVLTILTSMGILSFGFRVDWNSGTAPWEAILPRAIGLPQMDGGHHGVFILSLVPVAVIFTFMDKTIDSGKKIIFFIIAFLGTLGIAIALYRSAWLGWAASILLILLIVFSAFMTPKIKAFIAYFSIFISILVSYFFVQNLNIINKDFNNFFFEVRKRGVETRLMQYQYTFQEFNKYPSRLLYGYGHGSFREDFLLGSGSGLELDQAIGLHNHFLGFLYADGLPFFLGYLLLFLLAFIWLYKDSTCYTSETKLISLGLLAALVGIFVTLNFTAGLSGYKILWVIFAIAALIPELNTKNISEKSARLKKET